MCFNQWCQAIYTCACGKSRWRPRNMAIELMLPGLTLGTGSLQHCIQSEIGIFLLVLQSRRWHRYTRHSWWVRTHQTCCLDVCVSCVFLCFVCSWCSCFSCITGLTAYKHVPFYTWAPLYPGLADSSQACIHACILDHWLFSECSLLVHIKIPSIITVKQVLGKGGNQ